MSEEEEILLEKLAFLRKEKVISANPQQIFELNKRIEEIEKRLKEIRHENYKIYLLSKQLEESNKEVERLRSKLSNINESLEIDAIYDKILSFGYESLTSKQKEALFAASKKQ